MCGPRDPAVRPSLEEADLNPRSEDRAIGLGPRTTVFAVLQAYPFLEDFLLAHDPAFARVARPGGRTRWMRMTTLGDVALEMDVTPRRLVRDISAEVARVTGRDPPGGDARRAVDGDDAQLVALGEIAAHLEAGGSLIECAARLRDVTAGAGERETAALERALAAAIAEGRAAADLQVAAAVGPALAVIAGDAPDGHPLDSLRREGSQIAMLCVGLKAELDRLGGSPSRRRWRVSRPLVARLSERLSGVEQRVRREQEAWFPALAVAGEEGPAVLMRERQAEALEALRLLRLAVARDDAASAVRSGARLLDLLEGLAVAEEELLAPIAERALSPADWAVVREMEDAVGWALIEPPPRWPSS